MDEARTSTMELKSRTLPILTGVLLLFQLFDPYKGWMILLVGLGGAWLLSYLWARSLANGLEIYRESHNNWAKVGDLMLERFYLSNTGWAQALWVLVKDHSNLPGYEGNILTNIGGRSVNSWLKRNYCNLRGLYTFGPIELESGDPFGLYCVTVSFSATKSVLVLPPVVSLPAISITAGERVGDGRGQNFALEKTVSSASIREYVPGDNLRSIHWAQSARRDDLVVRVFDNTHSSDWWIILDMDDQEHVGEGENSTEEHAVILAASLVDRGRRMGRSIGLVSSGERNAWLPPKFGMAQYWEIIKSLAYVKPGSETLSHMLARTQPAMDQRTSVVLITPAVEGKWLDSLISMMRRGMAVTVLLIDQASFGGNKTANQTLSTLAAWGATHYLITPDVITMPEYYAEYEELSLTITSLGAGSDAVVHLNEMRRRNLAK